MNAKQIYIENQAILVTLAQILGIESSLIDGPSEAWDHSELTKVLAFFQAMPIEKFILQVRESSAPQKRLPLSSTANPFSDLSDESIVHLMRDLILNPDKEGYLSELLREMWNVQYISARTYAVVEAHANINEIDTVLFNQLIQLGFEPDDFYKLQPQCYTRNLTLAFKPDERFKGRYMKLRRLVDQRSREAASLIQSKANVDGFIESEFYPSSWIKKFNPTRSLQLDWSSSFPFTANTFLKRDIPRREILNKITDFTTDSRKGCDVHVKIPTEYRVEDYPWANLSSTIELRKKLEDSGFYEIISQSGNAIYTAQFLTVGEGFQVFDALDAFGTSNGGFIDLCVEVCTDFWRKSSLTEDGSITFAEVSPILSINEAFS